MIIMRLEDLALEDNVEHLATDWQISNRKDFANIIVQSMKNDVNKTSIVFPDNLDPTLTWYGRARCLLTTGYTVWGNLEVFTTTQKDTLESLSDLPSRISVPQITTNSTQDNHDVAMFEIYAKGFETVGNSTHFATSWIIEDIDGNVQWASLENSIYKESIPVSDIILKSGVVYRIKVMFHSTSNDVSPIGTFTFKTGDTSDIHLLTYVDDVDNQQPLQLAMNQIEGVTEVTWRIYGFVKDIAYNAWEEKISNANYTNVTVPANTLDENSIYMLEILPTSDTIKAKFIPFRTQYEGGKSKVDVQTTTFKPKEYAVRLNSDSTYTIPFTTDADELQIVLDTSKICSVERVDDTLVLTTKTIKTDTLLNLTVTGIKSGYENTEVTITVDLISDTSQSLTAVDFNVDSNIISLTNSAKSSTFTVDSPVSSTVRLGGYDKTLVTVSQTDTNTFTVEGNKNKLTGECVLTVICEQEKYKSNTKSIKVNIPSELIYEADFDVSPSSTILTTNSRESHFTVTKPTDATFTVESDNPTLFTTTKTSNTTFTVTANKTLLTGKNTATISCYQTGYDTGTKKITVTIPTSVVWPIDFSVSSTSVTLNNNLLEETIYVNKPTGATYDVVSKDISICTVKKVNDTTFTIIGNKTLKTGDTSVDVTCKQSGYSDTTISIAVSVPSELSWPVDFTVNPTSMVISNSSKSTTLTVKMPDLATMICESSDTELFTVAKQGTNVINIIGNSTRKTGTAEVKITVSKSGYTTSTTIVHVTISEPLNGRVEFSFAPTSISLTNANKTATVTVTVPEGAGWDIVSNDTSLFSVSKLSDTTFEIEGNHQLKTGNASFTINTWLSGYSVNSKSGSVVINTPLSWPVDVTADKSNILLNRDLANTTITLDMPTDATYTAVTSEGGG